MSEMDMIFPPRELCQQRIAVTTTGTRTALAANILGSGWVEVKAMGTEIDFQFGGAAVTVPIKDATGSDATVGHSLAAGQSDHVYITSVDTFIAYDAAGNGFLEIRKSGQKKTSP